MFTRVFTLTYHLQDVFRLKTIRSETEEEILTKQQTSFTVVKRKKIKSSGSFDDFT